MHEQTVRHGTGARIVIKSHIKGMIVPVTKGAVRITVGVSPILSTPGNEPVILARSA